MQPQNPRPTPTTVIATESTAPAAELVSAPDPAPWLLSLYPPGRPRRLARMSDPGETKIDRKTGEEVPRGKYEDDYRATFDRKLIEQHLAGVATYSCTVDKDGKARIGVIDVDTGGLSALQATLDAARRHGVTAFAIVAKNGGQHDGGHVVVLYEQFENAKAIEAQLRRIAADAGLPAGVEIWPGSNQGIRILFGVHRLTGSRGTLLTQAGELVDLDDDQTRAAAIELVISSPTNAPPPQVEQPRRDPPPAPATVTAPTHQPRRISPGEEANDRATLAEVKAEYNRTHRLSDMLTEGSDGLYFCDCGGHSSGRPKTAIWETGGEERAQSYSSDCRIFPLHRSGRYLTAFDYLVLTKFGGDVKAALKVLNPIAPRRSGPAGPPLPDDAHQTHYQTAAQARDAKRQRDRRKQAREERIARVAPLAERAPTDPRLYPFARTVNAFHVACWSDNPEHYASVETIARAVLHLSRAPNDNEIRRVQLAHERLIDAGYLVRTVRFAPGGRYTNCWRPGPIQAPEAGRTGVMVIRPDIAQQEAVNAASDHHDHDRKIISIKPPLACERRPQPTPARGEPDDLDTWQWCDDAHGADDLTQALVELPAPAATADSFPTFTEVEPARPPATDQAAELVDPSAPFSSSGVQAPASSPGRPARLDRALMGEAFDAALSSAHDQAGASSPSRDLLGQVRQLAKEAAEPGWYLRDYDEWPAAALEAELARLQPLFREAHAHAHDCQMDRATPIEHARYIEQIEPHNQANAGASYDPALDFTAGGRYEPTLVEAHQPHKRHEPPAAPEPESPTLAGVVRACFEQREPGVRLTDKRIMAAVDGAGLTYSGDEIVQVIAAERAAERARDEARSWCVERARVAALDDEALGKWIDGTRYAVKWSIGKVRESYHRARLTIGEEEASRRQRLRAASCAKPHPDLPAVEYHQPLLIEAGEWGGRSQAHMGAVLETGVLERCERELAEVER